MFLSWIRRPERAKELRRRRTAESLLDLGRVISRSLDPEEVAQQIGDSVWQLLGSESAAVYRLEEETGDLIALAVSGPRTPVIRGSRVPRGMGTIGRAVRDRGPIMSADLLSDPAVILSPELREFAKQRNAHRAVLAVPLIANDRVVGALAVGQRQGWVFDDEQIRVAQLFADQAALALDHARLYEETRGRLHDTETLLAVSQAAGSTAEPWEALRRITRLLAQAIGADSGGLLYFDTLEDRVVPLAGYRVPRDLQQLIAAGPVSLHHPFFDQLRHLDAPLCAPASQSDPRLQDDPWTRSFAHTSILILPVRVKDEVRAVFTLAWTKDTHAFPDQELRLVEAIASQAALGIENLELLEGLRSRQRSLEALLEAVHQLSSLQPLETVLHRIAEACGHLLGASSIGFRIVEGDELVVAGTFGDAKTLMPTARLKIGESLSGLIAQTGEPLVVPDLANDPRLLPSHREHVRRLGYQAFLGVPVKVGGRTAGVLTVHTQKKRGFSDEDVSIVSAFAAQAATAMENARLYEELRRAYEQVSLTQERLAQAQKMEAIGQLAGGVAHDFNNLLTVITGRAVLLREEIGDEPRLGRHVKLIERTASRAENLTRQLLAFGRKQILQPKVLDLNAVVGSVGTMLRRLISEDIDLLTKPGAACPAVKADPGQLEQVLMNLVVNARDAMPNGGRVTIETANVVVDAAHAAQNAEAKVGPYVELTVSDTGCGMDAATRAKIFEPFFTTKEPGKGTGLGLATVYGIVMQSGGHITVASEPERGTTFKIYLPAVADSLNAEEDRLLSTPRRGSETVLLVEDEEDLRDLVAEALETSGYTLLKAADCKDAVRIAAEHSGPIDLLLTDVIMPQMSGRDLAERIQPRRPTMAVLYMSGYTDGIIGHRGVLEPTVAFLQKPFAPSTVSHKVREVLDQHHSLDASGSRARSAEWAASRNQGGSSGR